MPQATVSVAWLHRVTRGGWCRLHLLMLTTTCRVEPLGVWLSGVGACSKVCGTGQANQPSVTPSIPRCKCHGHLPVACSADRQIATCQVAQQEVQSEARGLVTPVATTPASSLRHTLLQQCMEIICDVLQLTYAHIGAFLGKSSISALPPLFDLRLSYLRIRAAWERVPN